MSVLSLRQEYDKMANSVFSIIVCISVILLVTVQTAKVGDKCKTNSVCGKGSCVDGVCVGPKKSPIKCGNSTCLRNETCEYPLVKCKPDVMCPTPPPKCFPKPKKQNDTVTPIKPSEDKCGESICKKGETCVILLIKCPEGAACLPPPPYCVPTKSLKNNTNVVPVKPINPCATVLCKPPYKCKVTNYICKKAPCKKPTAKCVKINPCASKKCKVGYECIINKKNSTVAVCQLKNPCKSVKCKSGFVCQSTFFSCKKTLPVAKCVPKNPCAYTSCMKGFKCVTNKLYPTVAQCKRINPCSKFKCKSGFTCKYTISKCSKTPSSVKCVPKNPCAFTTCLGNNYCVVSKTDKTVAVCKPSNPCALVKCKSGYKCQVTKYTCKKLPCKPPTAKCVRKKPCIKKCKKVDPCAKVKCKSGYVCQSQNITCRPPCKQQTAKCVRKKPCTKKCKKVDPCAKVKCKSGYVCQSQNITCIKPPCKSPIAKCVRKNPCASTTCLKGFDCVPNKKNLTVAECIPRNPCAKIKCKAGYKCNVVTIYCLIPPCPPPSGECVPINPCTPTSCKEGLICTQQENDPTAAECVLTPCATVRCTAGFKCEAIVQNCTTVPCPRPQSQCFIDPEQNPCALVDCKSGYTCRNVPVDSCEAPPCSKLKAVCEPPKNPCDGNPCPKGSNCTFENGVASCSSLDKCEKKTCDKGFECRITVFPCLVPPCPSGPRCFPIKKDNK